MSDTSGIDKLTPKQQKFCQLYIETGSAAAAYRSTYACANMAEATVQREATRLLANPKVNHTITTLRERAAQQAVLNRSWVLTRLMENADVALARKTIRLKIQRRTKDGEISIEDVEATAHDPGAAQPRP